MATHTRQDLKDLLVSYYENDPYAAAQYAREYLSSTYDLDDEEHAIVDELLDIIDVQCEVHVSFADDGPPMGERG